MPSPRELLAVYIDGNGDWVATVQQGSIMERHVVVKCGQWFEFDDDAEADAYERAERLV